MSNNFQLWFKSTLFEILPGEDENTNPGCYGRSLAIWLRGKLIDMGYDVEDVIPEDWGWCVLCKRRPYKLWIGCGTMVDHDQGPPVASSTSGQSMTWTCFVEAEESFLRVFSDGLVQGLPPENSMK
jgi:hypothetical protein